MKLFIVIYLLSLVPLFAQCEVKEDSSNIFRRTFGTIENLIREVRLPKEILQDRKDALLIKDWQLRSEFWQRKSEEYLYATINKNKELSNVSKTLDKERKNQVKETKSLYEDMVDYAQSGADMIYSQMIFIGLLIGMALIGFGLYVFWKKKII